MSGIKKYTGYFAAAAVAVTLYSCGAGRPAAFTGGGDTLYLPRYAHGFVVESLPEGRLLRIVDPWQGSQGFEQAVFLAAAGQEPPNGFEGITVSVPVRSVVCMSSTYVAYIAELGRTDAVKGVSGAKYISNPEIRQAFEAGTVRDVGFDTNMNYELLAAIDPDAVLAYGITGENSVMSGKLSQLGIDLIYIGDYVEQSPLGKAEWLVAFGYLLGREEEAVGIFEAVEERYNGLKDMVSRSLADSPEAGAAMREPGGPDTTSADGPVQHVHYWGMPSVMLNSPYRDTWFVPGDRSYMVRLIEDAGGSYACAGEDSDASRPISLETAYVRMLSADVWLNPGQAATLAALKAQNPRFAATPPVVNGRVYNCNKRTTPEGGSDFWESGAVHPDVVLEDLVRIFHEGLLGDGETVYFNKLD
ncbi:MAG: iron ABC transporter substrate-binding protein [Alistipes sp.]|nr:iron ABC transporter substrate-binding protein [Alistipes sp.]